MLEDARVARSARSQKTRTIKPGCNNQKNLATEVESNTADLAGGRLLRILWRHGGRGRVGALHGEVPVVRLGLRLGPVHRSQASWAVRLA